MRRLQTQVDAFQEFGDRERQDDQKQEEMWCGDKWGCCSPLQCVLRVARRLSQISLTQGGRTRKSKNTGIASKTGASPIR